MALPDGTYRITASAIDQFGETTTNSPTTVMPALMIDTTAPVITGLTFDRFDGTMTVTFQDGLSGMDLASVANSAFYHLSARPLARDVHVLPLILPTSITVTPGATATDPVVATVVFHNGKELRGGLYTVVINSGSGNSGIEDAATNALDGNYYGSFSSGDGRPGGDFQALIATYHDVVKPDVPSKDGYVSPALATGQSADIVASAKTSSSAIPRTTRPTVRVSRRRAAAQTSRRPVRIIARQSAANRRFYDEAITHLVDELGFVPGQH